MKRCSKCGEEKPREEFYADKRAKDGLFSSCKVCFRETDKASYRKHHKKRLEYQAKYRAENPKKIAERNKRWMNNNPEKRAAIKKRSDMKRREAISQYNAEYYERTREAQLKRAAEYLSQNREAIYARRDPKKHAEYGRKRRAMLLAVYVAPVDEDEVIQRYLGRCGICDLPAKGPIEFDHIIPLARGGTHEPDNVQLTHRLCNRKKWARVNYVPESNAA